MRSKSIRIECRQPANRPRVRRRLLLERLGERRVLATLTGIVYEDTNESFYRETNETALTSRLVYLDQNDNGVLDQGERTEITGANGEFSFENVPEGTAIVRLFNGTETQRQTFPILPAEGSVPVAVASTQELLISPQQSVVVTEDGLVATNLQGENPVTVSPIGELAAAYRLNNGRVLAVGSSANNETAWLVDFADSSVSPIDLNQDGGATSWSSLSVGADGKGILLESSDAPIAVRSIDVSDPENITVTMTSTIVAPDTSVISSPTGARSILASPTELGLDLILWSNATGTTITESPVTVEGVTELLAFSDSTGLLALRSSDGGVTMLDVDGNFAKLYEFPSLTGPVALDAERDLLAALAPDGTTLSLVTLVDERVFAEIPLTLGNLGTITAVNFGTEKNSLVVVGTAGFQEVVLSNPEAHRVQIVADETPAPIAFGVLVESANTPPELTPPEGLETEEDSSLSLAAPGIAAAATDSEEDTFVVLQEGVATGGTATVGLLGSLLFTPTPDFFGTASFVIRLADGQGVSDPITIEILVTPVPDPPASVDVIINPTPENLPLGAPVGIVDIIDVDLIPNHVIFVDDPRFGIDGNQIIFIGGGLDFETEPLIPLVVTVVDPQTQTEVVKQTVLTITDANDPITGIVPNTASIRENLAGDLIAELVVLDQDAEQSHLLTVDDERFVIDLFDLRLAEGVALDFETTPVVIVRVTATELIPNGTSFTQDITINVIDVPEQPTTLGLTGETVVEKTPGAEVGDVTIDGAIASSRYTLSVNDPRFEIAGTKLKLIDNESVELATQSEIELQITATDSQNEFAPLSSSFVITVIKFDLPFHNADLPEDVDFSGQVTAADALEIIHYLNIYGPGPVGQGDPGFGYDVNGDGRVTALDALLVINKINVLQSSGGTVGGEPEQIAQDSLAPASQFAVDPSTTDRYDDAIVQTNRWTGSQPNSTSAPGNSGSFAQEVNRWLQEQSDDKQDSALAAVDEFLSLLDPKEA